MDTTTHTAPGRILVLGIGNTLLGDEGIGVHAMQALRAALLHTPPAKADIEFLDGGTLSFTLASAIEDAEHLLILDAAQLNAAPGSIGIFEDAELDEYLGSHRKRSVHEVGLIDLMIIARLTDRLPRRRALIGIQPETIEWSEGLSPRVAAALPAVVAKARTLMEDWHYATA